MRRRFGQSLRLGVAADGLALLRVGGWPRAGVEVLATAPLEAGAPDALANGLRALLDEANPRGWPLTVVLADELVRLWQVAPPPGAARFGDLQAAAALRFQSLFGGSADGWKIAADWDPLRPFLAAAIPRALLSVLEQAAQERRCHLVEALPQFVAALNQWRRARRADAWFGLCHGGVLTNAVSSQGALEGVRAVLVPHDAGHDWLDVHVAREALRLGVAPPQHLQLCGAVPARWSGAGGKVACSLLGITAPCLSETEQLALTGSGRGGR
jgi:hypothetical protein